jgi:hypothetical protein
MVEKGAIRSSMEIIDFPLFNELNEKYSNLARSKYGVLSSESLFTREVRTAPRLGNVPERREGTRDVLRAVPNPEMFNELQEKHDEFKKNQGIFYQVKEESATPTLGPDANFMNLLLNFFNKNGFTLRIDELKNNMNFLEFSSGIDLIQKEVYAPNENFVPTKEAAILAVSLLKKTEEYYSLANHIKAWDQYDERRKYHIQQLKNGYGLRGTELLETAERYVMYDFVEKYIVPNYDASLKADKSYKDGFINKAIMFFKRLLKKLNLLKPSFEQAEMSARKIASEILNNTINFQIKEDYELKQSIALSKQDNEVKVDMENRGFILTGSAALRMLGDLYRGKDEVIKDLDFIMSYDDFKKLDIDLAKIDEKTLTAVPEEEYVNKIKDAISEMLGDKYKFEKAFVGPEHKGNKSVTLTFNNNGTVVDVFVRTSVKYKDEFSSTNKLITDQLTNKLMMAKDKHITDFLFFKPKTELQRVKRSPSVQILNRLSLNENFEMKKRKLMEYFNLINNYKEFENDDWYYAPGDAVLEARNEQLLKKIYDRLGKEDGDYFQSLIQEAIESKVKYAKEGEKTHMVRLGSVIRTMVPRSLKNGIVADINFVDEKVDSGLDEYLTNWAKKYNIDIKNISEFVDAQQISLSGAVDVVNKIIYLANSEDRNVTTMAEEVATMMVFMMGTEFWQIKSALNQIKNYPKYNEIYLKYSNLDRYKTKNENGVMVPDVKKINIEILTKAIAERVVIKYKARNYINSFWAEIDKIIDWFVKKFKDKNFLNLDVILDNIAEDILSEDSKFIQPLPKDYVLKDYQQTIKENPQLVGLLDALMPIGFIPTGSLSYRNQLDTYRGKDEKIHDLDLVTTQYKTMEEAIAAVEKAVPDFWIPNFISPMTKVDGKKMWEEPGKFVATGYSGGELIGKIGVDFEIAMTADGKEIPHTVKRIGTDELVKETARDEKGNVYGGGVLIDLFIEKNRDKDFVVDDQGLAHYVYSYDEKLRYGRPKDSRDLIYSKNRRNVTTLDNKYVFYQTSSEEQTPEAAKQEVMKQKFGTEGSRASKETIAFVKDFLKRIGVSIKSGKQIVLSDGRMLDDNAIAEIMSNLIHVMEGKEDVALTEEAMHFAVEIIEQTDPKLFNKLLGEINKYKIYNDVLSMYGSDPDYQTSDGKPDIRKIKKEAIGRLLAEVIINKKEGLTEKPELLEKVGGWWSQFINLLKGLFVKSGFDQAALKILSGENIGTVEDIKAEQGTIYKQKSKQDEVWDKVSATSTILQKKDEVDEDGKPTSAYYVGDKRVGRRVSDLVNDWYERRFRSRDLIKSDYQNAVDDLKAEKGTLGHKDMENAFSLFVDDDGYLRDVYLTDDDYESKLNKFNREMYETLRDNLRERLESFPKGTRFKKEAMIYDAQRNIAGTVDFLAIEKTGKVHILDWKFMDLNIEKHKDVPWYKIGAWNLQMDQYKLILKNAYGVKEEDFGQTRMIPIKAEYTLGSAKENRLPILVSVTIGDVNVKNIVDSYLLPVGLEREKTGNRKIDELLEKLNAIYKKMSEEKVLPSEKLNKSEQLNALFSAIRKLQIQQDIKPLIYQAQVLNKQIKNLITTFENKYRGQDAKSFSDEEINNFAGSIIDAANTISIYTTIDTYLRFLFQGELTEEQKELREKLRDTADDARDLEADLNEISKEFVDKIVASSENVNNILAPEKIIKGLTKLFGSTSTIQLKALEFLYKKANKSFAYAAMDTLDETKKLMKIKERYDQWAASKGLSKKDYFKILMKEGKNELIDEYNVDFYKELRKKIQDKDFEWIKNNVDVEEFKNFMNEKLREEIQRIEDRAVNKVGTDEEIAREVKREKADAIKLFDTSEGGAGWYQYDLIRKFPQKKWESKQWTEITAKGNEAAKEFYDYIVERNNYYHSIGYINAKQMRVFLPYVRKNVIEKLIFGGNISLGEQFLRSVSVDEGDIGYGKTDPITGKPIDTVPIYFTKEIEGELSTDLFRNMALYNEMAIKYKYISDIEDQVRAVVRLEKNKRAIKTSHFGKTQYKETGEIDTNPDNSENAKLVEDMMKAIIYGQRYLESESFDQVLGKLGNFGEKLNKKLGRKIFPENLSGRQVSINKVVTQLNNVFQLKTLGLNILSATSNFFGGTAQSVINAGTYFTKSDYFSTEAWMLMNKMGGEDKKKAIGALHYFLPLTENYNKEIAKKLSLTNLSQERIQEFLMILMKETDLHVQSVNFFSFLKNSIVENGEVVNVREMLRATPKYSAIYSGTVEERKRLEDEFEEDVQKLIEEKGVLKLGQIVNDEFVIPGVDRKSQSVIDVRRKVQNISKAALGNLSEDDLRKINMNIMGKSFMIFKNWIPRLVDVRFGNIKYNSASDAYEWGRMRNVYRIISEDVLGSLGNLKNSLLGNEKGVEFLRQLYEKKKADYLKDTGKELEMTEDEFINLVRSNVRNQLYDTVFLLTLMALFAGLKALPPDDDEDPAVKNQYKYLLRGLDKLRDELMYFYDPTSVTSLVSKGVFPSVNLIENGMTMIKNFGVEMFALAVGDEELEEKNYVLKYVMKTFPVASQAAGILPMFYPEAAKDLGIKMQSRSGIR